MSEQKASQWRVKVQGGDQVNVRPGESLEIGRKPLRPLADNGIARLEIDDSTKSMSKRHARFSVSEDGQATLRDLNSTNGSYVVNAGGELMRLPADRDFPLPSSPMRIQFGDVPVDFVAITTETIAAPKVPNLFEYSASTTRQEPDAADMSVDDILDLRAGEPTAVFSAQHARHARPAATPLAGVAATAEASAASATPAASTTGATDSASSETPAATPDTASGETSGTAVPTDTTVPVKIAPTSAPVDVFADDSSTIEEPSTDSMPLRVVEPIKPSLPRDLFVDALSDQSAAGADETDEAVSGATEVAEHVESASAVVASAESAAPSEASGTVETSASAVASSDETPAQTRPADDTAAPRQVTFVPMNAGAVGADAASRANDDEFDATGVFTPAFEPGSVFEKVSKGEFDKPQEPAIEVDGLTSEDARRTTDMTVQFEMAKHPELLPFLAMNPALYDDLYEWLAAQGDHDIDEALAHNTGYQDYREAVGK